MQRNHQAQDLWRHRSWFFWYQCCACNKDFRRELGWRAFTGPYYGGHGVFRYICGSCASTREQASGIINSAPWVPKMRPKAPAPPPRPSQGDWILVKGVRVPRLYSSGAE